MSDVVCLGILIADIFGSQMDAVPAAGQLKVIDRYLLSAGGCAANTAACLTRLGRTASVLGKVGDDLFGSFVLQDLKRLGIETLYVKKSTLYPTSCTFIVNVRGQDRRYIHCFGANADFSFLDVDPSALEGARALYVGGYLAMPAFLPKHLTQLFRAAKHRGLITALDVVIPAEYPASLESVASALPYTDVFLPNRDEALVLTGRADPIDQAEVFARLNPDCTVIITQGRDGVVTRRGERLVRAGAFKVDSVDGSGAGDAFTAGFLVGALETWSLEDSLRFASAVGASCTRALGCTEGVFRFEEAAAFVSQNPLHIVPSA